MTAKEFLQDIRSKRRLLESMQQRADELRVMAEGVGAIRYDKDRVQVSPMDHMSETTAALIELEEQIGRMIVEYNKAIILRVRMIEKLNDPRYIQLLTLRYIDCLRFEEISCRMSYSWQHILRLHGEALTAFARQYSGQF